MHLIIKLILEKSLKYDIIGSIANTYMRIFCQLDILLFSIILVQERRWIIIEEFLTNYLLDKRKKLLSLLQAVDNSYDHFPDGTLIIHVGRKHNRFYKSCPQDKIKLQYLNKKNSQQIVDLALKKYVQRIKPAVQSQIKAIDSFLLKYDPESIYNKGDFLEKLPNDMRVQIPVFTQSDEQYIKEWLSNSHGSLDAFPTNIYYITDNGEHVRSKSELLIANKLFALNIPYKYEQPLLLASGVTLYPDFTILDIRRRREIYLEHFGMIDNPEYSDKAVKKIDEYARNGIFIGSRLFITMESSITAGYISTFDVMIKTILSDEHLFTL